MMARHWKIRKEQKWCASLAGGATCNSLPSWEGDRAADEYFGVPTAPRRETLANPRHGLVDTEQDANRSLKWALTRKVIRRYKMKIQWLVLNP